MPQTYEKKGKLSIIISCLNEAENVHAIFSRINQTLRDILEFETIFVDDGSSDETANRVMELQKTEGPRVKLVIHPKNMGIYKSWKSGIKESEGEIVCLIDGDLQNPPESIVNLLEELIGTASDFVQGSRGYMGDHLSGQFIMLRNLNRVLNLVFKQDAKDSSSGFVVAYKSALEEILEVKRNYKYFQTFLGVSARSKGFKVSEVETYFVPRIAGKTVYSKWVTIGILMDFVSAIREFGRKKSFRIGGLALEGRFEWNVPKTRALFYSAYFYTAFLHKWIIGKNAIFCYKWLKQVEFMSREQIVEIQNRRLWELLTFAKSQVPFYRRQLANLDLSDFGNSQSYDVLKSVPLLTKEIVRRNIHFSMFSDRHKKSELHKISTSGSTGEPFVCYADKFQLEMRHATTLRALEMAGWRFGERQIRLWHQTLGLSKSKIVKERLDALFMRRTFVPAFEFTEKKVEELLQLISIKKPTLIDGYAESLNFISSEEFKGPKTKLKAVMSSAQQLTDSSRKRIEDKFSTKVFDKYGSREFSGIAYQCDFGTYHVQDESYFVEILINGKAARPGQVGEVVITDLNNYSVPLIRYVIGDLALEVEQNTCKCGRKHRAIGKIVGRTQALIHCHNGVWLPGTFFAHFFKEFEYAIRQYQIFQERFSQFELRIVPNIQYTTKIMDQILDDLREYIGETKVDVSIVQEIPLLKTGKRTPVISLLSASPEFKKEVALSGIKIKN
jgi:phenylacetate-CoA ligase